MRLIFFLILNLAMSVMATCGVVKNLKMYGVGTLRYYTTDSNLLLAIAALISAGFAAAKLCCGTEIPNWCNLLFYAATNCVALTFLIVIFVLAPRRGYKQMLLCGQDLFLHLICPLCAILTFLFFRQNGHWGVEVTAYALLPTILYTVVLVILCATDKVKPPYFFLNTRNQKWYQSLFWTALVLGMNWTTAWLLQRLG